MENITEIIENINKGIEVNKNIFSEFQDAVDYTIDDKIITHWRIEKKKEALDFTKKSTFHNAVHSENIDQLKEMLKMKSDKVDLEKVYDIKCNKIDFENMLDV